MGGGTAGVQQLQQQQQQQALQVHGGAHDNNLSMALSAKEARIHELRGALAQCRAEKGALQVQLEVSV